MKLYKLLVLTIILSIISLSCNQQKTKWQGSIKEVDGVTVVKNPIEPMYGEEIIEIEKDLSIKEDLSDEGLIFERLTMLCVDDDGNIYAVDMQAGHIKVFNKLGKHTFNIGKKGQGPGEFIMPFRIQFVAPDRIMVLDVSNYRLSWFLNKGELLHEVSVSVLRPGRVESDLSDNLVVRVLRRTEDGSVIEIKKLDSQLNELFKISSQILQPTPTGTFPMQTAILQFHISPNGFIIWGETSKYEFHVVDEYGKTVKKIMNKYIPIKITSPEKKRLIELEFGSGGVFQGREPTFPDYFLPFSNFLIDDEGRIIARTYKHRPEGIDIYDIFDIDGKYLVSIPLKSFPQVWKKDKLYFIERDEEGYQIITRYQVNWKI